MKCPKCHSDNTDTARFCNNCATPLHPSEEIPVSPTKTLGTPKEELSTGSTFAGRYQIIEELGKGGMGMVYKALDKEVKAKIALKLIKPEIAADKKTIGRFRNELKTARDITHKNVCRMYDLNKEEGSYYITMEYVEGQDLKGLIRQTGKLATETAISIAKQVCEGLAEAHKLGTVHRDLKPQNIMIDKEGNARIMDFGIARSLKAKGITGEGVMIGTPEYMSPEQAEAKAVDQRSDIYSLGVILYEMVTGRVPFEGETPLAIAMKQISEKPKDPKTINADIPYEISRLILNCLEKKKEKRYKNVEELLSELARITKPKMEKIITPQWKNSIAVLPFRDMSAEKDQDYFCEGIAEEIINTLTHIEGLRVIARTSAFAFKDKLDDVREIGKKLGVDTLLEGSVRKAGNRVRITAQLIAVADGSHLWSERYDREIDDLFRIQDEVSLKIAENLKIKLGHKEKTMLAKRYTEDIETYNLYLKGRFHWSKYTREGFEKGIEYHQQAIERDPTYAPAYAGIAICNTFLGYYLYLNPKEEFDKAETAAKKALEIDDRLAEAHLALAWVKMGRDWNLPETEAEFKRALELNPGYSTGHLFYGGLLSIMCRHKEAIAEQEKAEELDPLSPLNGALLGLRYYYDRDYTRAIQKFQRTLEMSPHFVPAYWMMALPLAAAGQIENAIAASKKAIQLLGEIDPIVLSILGVAYSLSPSRKKDAQEVIEKLKKLSRKKQISPFFMGVIYTGLGKKDLAFEWFERSYKEREPLLVWLKPDPIVNDRLQKDPRYIKLIKKMGLER